MCGCTRKGTEKDVTNGIYYVVEGWTEEQVMLRMHPDFAVSHSSKVSAQFPALRPFAAEIFAFVAGGTRTAGRARRRRWRSSSRRRLERPSWASP
jgi:hypothetical protein